jgi:putative transposon-encoded protein
MRRLSINKGKLLLEDNVVGFFQKKVTKFGTGAKVDCTREHIGKTAYVIICDG